VSFCPEIRGIAVGIDRPEALFLGWFMIVGGAAITLLRHRLAQYQHDQRSIGRGRRPGSPVPGLDRRSRSDLAVGSAILAAIGVLLMFGGLLLIADQPIRWMLGLP
jgi:hypothetical protein